MHHLVSLHYQQLHACALLPSLPSAQLLNLQLLFHLNLSSQHSRFFSQKLSVILRQGQATQH